MVTGNPGGEPKVEYVDVPPVDKDRIVDTNGAGDSFVGGFFASLAKGEDLLAAVAKGNALAGKVIQKSGCVFE